ncbi:MAG: hypothetical protein WBD03_00490 [Thermoplasmata archaeon]
MKTSWPWLKVVLIVALTIVLTAIPCIIYLDSDFGYLLTRTMLYVGSLLGVVALYLTKFRGRAMVGTPDSTTDKLARELMASGYIVERVKGRLNVRIDRSVGAVVVVKQRGGQRLLYYGLETMPRGAAWVIFLSICMPPIAMIVVVYYLSKVIRFGGEPLDRIALNASQRREGQEKSVKEMLIEGISEARRMSLEAYEAVRCNYQDMLILSLVLGLVSMIITVVLLLYLTNISSVIVDGEVALWAGAVAFVGSVILSFVFVRRRYRPKLNRLRVWKATLSNAFESEGYPTSEEVTPDSHFELLAKASREIPEWLEIRRKSMLAREPSWSMVVVYAIYFGAMAASSGAIAVSQGAIGGLILFCFGAFMTAIGVIVYTITARRMASEAKTLEDSWRRRSEQMTAEMENLLGGKA